MCIRDRQWRRYPAYQGRSPPGSGLRDHGGVIFIDLRDREGLIQVVIDPDTPDIFSIAEQVRNEFVLKVSGRVRARPAGTTNDDLPTGQIEVLAKDLVVLNAAETPPFQLDDEDVQEETRMRFRYVDLRRPEMQKRMRCLLYTSPSPRDATLSRMPSSA